MNELTTAQRIRAEARRATRRALLEAGLAATLERGGEIPGAAVICAKAGYTRGAFYEYFTSRDDYIAEMLDWVLDDIVRTLFLTPTEQAADLPEVLARFGATVTREQWPELHDDLRAGYLAILREIRLPGPTRDKHAQLMHGVVDRMQALLVDGQLAGTVRADVDPRATAMMLLTTAVGGILWSTSTIPYDGGHVAEVLARLLAPDG